MGEDKSTSDLLLRFNFNWDMNLDPSQEHSPYAHFYLSTNYSDLQVVEIDLEQARGSRRLKLEFNSEALKRTSAIKLLQGCNLNVDLYVWTKANYGEPVSNPAGSMIIPLHEIVSYLSPGSDGALAKPIILYMVHDEKYKYSKGSVTLSRVDVGSSTKIMLPFLRLNGNPISPQEVKQASIQGVIRRAEKNQHACAKFIEATEILYEGVDPTIDAVANINSAIWVSRAGVFPPVFFTLDVVKPVITERFYQNCLNIVLKRLKLSREDVLRLDISGDNKRHIATMGSIAGQILCCYIVHFTYRTDYAIVYDKETEEFIKILTENFGDVSVDKGAGMWSPLFVLSFY